MTNPAGLDWTWAQRTGGNLTALQRRRLLAVLGRTVPRFAPGRLRLALGRRGTGRVEDVRLPDTRLAREAELHAREELSDALLAHSFRTYFFGRALADLDGAEYDDEIAYVSCLLHDIALEKPTPGRCFAVVGGESAVGLARRHGASAERAAIIGAAIAAHLTPGVAADLGDPGGFVSAGASVDVLGDRLADLDPRWVGELLARHPRHQLKKHLAAVFAAEAAAVPEGRVAWLTSTGFTQLVKFAPFPE
ncbi:HD domain-containing protein [Nocardia ignorata]|uniref:HD domain-containing protein n=1 Tax=Nocardia ignorata TaxID=145285 RepID=A0A4R6PW19_NOCIG|nr:HD domain-containing protein [Nocardia ignorata]TDP43145.1 HD domain-containing protein [Nocardia ignorata]